ncbi:HNH endonuclease signature motif containing protein [Mycobacterium sp. NPDC050041]|uniref:HNH endonuclease signature motif containing protein n=1 Tax=Mycobacterium sp. NPDC050041 TaxID=3364293 RepID=UPI003C2ABB17
MEAVDYLALLDMMDEASVEAASSCENWAAADILAVRERLETHRRRQPALEHRLIGRLDRADPADLGGSSLKDLLVHRLRISSTEAGRRITDAQQLGPRRALTGQPLPPLLAHTAAAQAEGRIGDEHIQIIRNTLDKKLPSWVDGNTRDQAEHTLASIACTLDPEQLQAAADRLVALIDPDGPEPAERQARKRHLTLGRQDADGMSRLTAVIDPQCRATLEPLLAKLAAPGMCNPDDDTPTVDGEPDSDAARRDLRSPGQRRHDALTAIGRTVLASGKLGQHHGLPVSVIASTTVQELQRGAGVAVTGGGSLLPMADLIRMASHAYHYLAVFDEHTQLPLYLGRARRIASAAQRIVLHAMDRGCTRPGCTVPGYWCQVDHLNRWADGGATDITDLGLACGPDNRMKEKGWTTRRINGRVHWIPPEHLDTGQPRTNRYHHPQEYLAEPTADDDDGERPGAA